MVQVVVPTMLAAQAEGRRSFDVEAKTTGDALRATLYLGKVDL